MTRFRIFAVAAAAVVVLVVAAGAAAVFTWPHLRLAASDTSLAHVSLPSYAGRVAAVRASAPAGIVPVELRHGEVRPTARIPAGIDVAVEVTVRRPRWIGWLVGRSERRTLVVHTPVAHVRDTWIDVPAEMPVQVAFDAPVARVAVGRSPARELAAPASVVDTGRTRRAGSVRVAAAARPWETLSAPVTVHWFPASSKPQVLVRPRPGTRIRAGEKLTLVFSRPVESVLGGARAKLTPATPGHWRQLDDHTLRFVPTGFGFGLGATVHLKLPRAILPTSAAAATTTLTWTVEHPSTLRLQQVLARLHWLPLVWTPEDGSLLQGRALLRSATQNPAGTFHWRYAHTPPELRRLWTPGTPNEITRGAVMAFESEHDLPVDGLAGPKVWRELLSDAAAGALHPGGYSYVFVHRALPQSLSLWHDGKVIVSSPGNTGIPEAPTELGTFPVFEHITVGTMSGTNPDGTHYDDPGVRWISYFNGGDAIHAFPRRTYGSPQSLGCVELPDDAAAEVWPYTPIGTLVTIED